MALMPPQPCAKHSAWVYSFIIPQPEMRCGRETQRGSNQAVVAQGPPDPQAECRGREWEVWQGGSKCSCQGHSDCDIPKPPPGAPKSWLWGLTLFSSAWEPICNCTINNHFQGRNLPKSWDRDTANPRTQEPTHEPMNLTTS